MSPAPTFVIILGFVGGGVLRAMLIACLVTGVSMFFADLSIHNISVILSTVVLTSCLFSMAGLINAVFAKTFDDISIIPTFILTPLTYLGGVFYSLNALPEFWQNLSQLNPIVYMINGFRYGFLGADAADFSLVTSYTVLFGFNAILLAVAYGLISRGVGTRS